jgi:uncharacterized protein (TIGR02145 family)/uncharacterized repeat protein (TIGR02543 family)
MIKSILRVIAVAIVSILVSIGCQDDNEVNFGAGEGLDAFLGNFLYYTVTYDIYGGIGTIPSAQIVAHGNSVVLANEDGFARHGFAFVGWNASPNGTGDNHSAGTEFMPASDITLFAVWSLGYRVAYDINGGTGTTPDTRTVVRGNSVILANCDQFTRDGFAFVGWNTSPDGTGDNYDAETELIVTGSITLFAMWDVARYTVTYDINGGAGTTPSARTVTHGNSIILPNEGWFIRDGFTLVGWNTNPDGTGNNYRVGTSFTPTSNITLFAMWDGSGGCGVSHGHFNPNIAYGSFIDERDRQCYRTVTIGAQTWMAENLKWSGNSGNLGLCFYDDPSNCEIYGRLYDWWMVMAGSSSSSSSQSGVQGICPDGWHVPSDAEWTTLVNFVGGWEVAGTRLMAQTGWEPRYSWHGAFVSGTDDHGFSALPGGGCWGGDCTDLWFSGPPGYHYSGTWWSSSAEEGCAFGRNIHGDGSVEGGVAEWYCWDQSGSYSLRCVKTEEGGGPLNYTLTVTASPVDCATALTGSGSHNAGVDASISVMAATGCTFTGWTGASIANANSTNASVSMDADKTVVANFTQQQCGVGHGHFNPDITYGSFIDERNGQCYRTVTIGSQTWIAENLNWADSDGDLGWCYGNNPANCDLYGRLYDWATVMGFDASCNTTSCASQVQSRHRGICPPGWHVPSDAEWTTLVSFVGGSSIAGTLLKTLTGWNSNTGTDFHGFSALPGGVRGSDGIFWNVGTTGLWWNATESSAANARYRNMNSDGSNMRTFWDDKASGFSLRCVKTED